MLIQGKAKFIPRAKVPAPMDGVHVNGKDGLLKGTHAVLLGENLIPKGRVGMYVRKNEETGIKVFYSLSWGKAQKLSYVKKIFRKWRRLYEIGVSPKPEKIVTVEINLTYKGKKHKAKALGIKTSHIHYPEDAWRDYMYGNPYRWDCLSHEEHPLHNPEGYMRFVKWAKKEQKKHGLETEGSYKLGDVVYCIKRKRYFLVDID